MRLFTLPSGNLDATQRTAWLLPEFDLPLVVDAEPIRLCIHAVGLFVAGADAVALHLAGGQAGDVFDAGARAGEQHAGGSQRGATFTAGARAGNVGCC